MYADFVENHIIPVLKGIKSNERFVKEEHIVLKVSKMARFQQTSHFLGHLLQALDVKFADKNGEHMFGYSGVFTRLMGLDWLIWWFRSGVASKISPYTRSNSTHLEKLTTWCHLEKGKFDTIVFKTAGITAKFDDDDKNLEEVCEYEMKGPTRIATVL